MTELVEVRFCESEYLRPGLRLRYLNTGKPTGDSPTVLIPYES